MPGFFDSFLGDDGSFGFDDITRFLGQAGQVGGQVIDQFGPLLGIGQEGQAQARQAQVMGGGVPGPVAPAQNPPPIAEGNALQVLTGVGGAVGRAVLDPRIQLALGLAAGGAALLGSGDDIEDLFVDRVVKDKCGNESVRRSARSQFVARDDETGRMVTYRNMGQPVLYSGDLAACRRVERAASRASGALKRSTSPRRRRRKKTTRRRRCPSPATKKRTTRTRGGVSSAQAKARAAFAAAARKAGGKVPRGTDLGRPGPRI